VIEIEQNILLFSSIIAIIIILLKILKKYKTQKKIKFKKQNSYFL